jgi:nitronate monooxygenase
MSFWPGTRLIATTESRAKDAYKDAVVSSGPDDIECTDRISGNPANWLIESIKDFKKMPDVKSKRWLDLWSAGRSVAQAEEIIPAGDVIREMVKEYIVVCKELAQEAFQA